MDLIIVESPTKARTLGRFLKGDYQIEATIGHIRDLPQDRLGVDVASDFRPTYVIPPKKKKTVAHLKKVVKGAEKVILATDSDREGEAIAWHVTALMRGTQKSIRHLPTGGADKTQNFFSRIVFHEITKEAITEALKNPREIDINLVDAQQGRRVLDRLVGYKLSPLLWYKVRRGLSAGRVQSVTLRLIVEREREIEKFKKEEYWRIFVDLAKDKTPILFELIKINEKKLEERQIVKLFDGEYTITKTTIKTQKEAEKIIEKLQDQEFKVVNITSSDFERTPPPPFTTSTLQQDANRRLGFSSKQTMAIAQKLYEEGKITYHRTDSVALSENFLKACQKFVKETYGADFSLAYFRKFQTKQKLAQEAHEAIRPTNVFAKPEGKTKEAQGRLYELIFKRAVSTQMANAKLEKTQITVLADNGEFVVQGVKVLFPGFLILYPQGEVDKVLPPFKEGEVLKLIAFHPTQKFTEPPPRYNEASLIKSLEEKGIGRPSTYAPIISTIGERQYVEKIEKKFQPTVLGFAVSDFLVANFPEVVDIPFTAKMEDSLDSIARGEVQWVPVIREFWDPFSVLLAKVYKEAQRVKIAVEETDKKCPSCGSSLVIRLGRYGKFLACSQFPKCHHTERYIDKTGLTCPKCKGEIIIKRTKRGKQFYGCSNYPKCDFAAWKKEQILVHAQGQTLNS